MKKSYKKPTAKIVDLEVESIICGSPEMDGLNSARPVGDDESNNMIGGSRSSLWGED